jgi:hypothetical protein
VQIIGPERISDSVRVCGKVYVNGVTEAKYKERKKHVGLDQPGKWVVAEHITKMAHRTDFSGISILHRTSGYLTIPYNWTPNILTESVASC